MTLVNYSKLSPFKKKNFAQLKKTYRKLCWVRNYGLKIYNYKEKRKKKTMGCFTANSNSFITRPWEAQGIFSYSIFQPISRIFVEISGKKIMRILPYVDSNEWISNKSRFQEKELMYIYPETCLSVVLGTSNIIITRISSNVNKDLFTFKKAVQLFLRALKSQKVIGLILNAYVDVKEASNIRALVLSTIKVNIYISK